VAGSTSASQPPASPPISVSVTPTTATVLLGKTTTLAVTVSNTTNSAVRWSVNDIAGGNAATGTISNLGVYAAPQILPVPASVTVTATSAADPTKSASATITIASDVSVSISPSSAAVELGAQQAFQAAIASAGQPSTTVNWTIQGTGCAGAGCGTVSAAGVFTAPSILPSPPTIALTATSAADPSKSVSAAVTITSSFSFSVSGPASLLTGTSAAFTAALTPAPNSNPDTAISWSVSGAGCAGAACGTITSSGATATYTAPSSPPSPDQVVILATPLADPSKAASVTLTITATSVTVSLSPTAATVALGATTNFSASVSGSSNTGVTWDVNGTPGGDATVGTIVADPTNPDQATYTAPAVLPMTNPVTVHARSQADSNAAASASVTLISAISVSLDPASATLAVNNRQTFTAQIQNSADSGVTWTVNGVLGGDSTVGQICVVNSNPCQTVASAAAGSVDYLAPPAVPSLNPVTLRVTSNADSTKSATASITVLPHVVVSVSPPSATLAPGASQLFTATVAGTSDQQVSWSISGTACGGSGAPCGTIDASGLYQAPATPPSPNTLSVVATSSADTTRSASATVTISAQPTILSLSPSSAFAGASGGFALSVTGANFTPSSPGPGSTILIGGIARTTVCSSAADCSTNLSSADLSLAGNLSVSVQNPDGFASNSVAFVVVPISAGVAVIPLTPGAPVAAGMDITVVDLSTDGSSSPSQDVNLNVVAIGPYDTATGSCTLGGGAVALLPPASGTATADLCAFSVSGLDPSFTYTLTGPSPNDITIVGEAPLGLGIVHLTLQISSTAQPGARTLFIENSNFDVTAATGAIDVR
jgi:uncharacterized protein YjdB